MIKLSVVVGPDAGSVFTPQGDMIVLGRSSHKCDVVLHDEAVSRRHCTIERQGGGFVITDSHTANGTFLNTLQDRVEKRELKNEDEIILGRSRLRVELTAEGETAEETPSPSPTEIATGKDGLDAVRQPDVPIVLTVVKGPDRGQVYSPSEDVISLGKAETCTVVLHDPAVSRVHAFVKREAGKYRLYDENSKNGTFLRTPDNRIRHADLADGDVIYLGSSWLLVAIHLQEKLAEVNPEGLTLISGKIGEREFTFTLALPIRSARTVQDEEATQAVEGDGSPASHEERPQVAPAPMRPQLRIALRVTEGPDSGTVFEPALGVTSFSVGRGKAADFRLQDQGASRIHFSVETTPTGFVLVDAGSLNGTFINQGTEKVSRVELKGGEKVRFSATCIQVEVLYPEGVAAEESSLEGLTTVAVAPPPLPAQEQHAVAASSPAAAAPAAAAPPEEPAVEDVRSRSAAFKSRLEKIARHKGVILKPFTMPGSARQWVSLALMLFAALSSYGFFLSGRSSGFSAGPVAQGHAKLESDCATCHPSWGVQAVNATCVTAKCHANVLKTKEQVSDDCVSCHTEHRGRTFNIKGGRDLCWNCHEKGLGVRPFSVRPMKVYYEQVAVPAGATESKSGRVVDPLRLQLPATEAARRKLQQSVSAEESGLIYGHAIHEKDVKKANYTKGVACFDCHKQIPDVGGISFPTHAECIECHKEVGNRDPKEAKASASEQCLKCHLSQEGGITRIQRKITYVQFSHNDHTETTCNRCHFIVRDEQAYRPVLRSAVLYPLPMEACYSCHEQRRATTACLDCHREHHSYPAASQVAEGWLSNLSLGSVILTLLVGVVGAGAYTYFDTRLVRNWLESSDAPPPPEAREASSSPTPAPPAKDGVMPFPAVDAATCISCHGCYDSCPTKVLAGDPVTAKSTVVDPKACKSLEGCRICEEKCPTGAIRVTLAPLQREVERAQVDEHNESNIPGLFLAGEVIGAALIKKAVNQGDQISRYIAERKPRVADAPYDVVIVGAGPAGLGAGLEAQRHGLRYLLLERGTIASTIRDYPRDKAVLAEPVLLPQYGLLKMMDTKKETLIAEWENVIRTSGLRVNEREEVLDVKKTDGLFTVTTGKGTYQGAYVILGIGTRGNPRKIGVSGEDLPKVTYHLIDAAEFKGKKVLVVGGGDSAIEAAVALAKEEGTVVTLSYRQAKFSRIKSRNADAIAEQEKAGRVAVIFNSSVTKITERSVTLKVGEEERELENDAVFALIGGDPPKTWLQKTGVNIVTVKETVGSQW